MAIQGIPFEGHYLPSEQSNSTTDLANNLFRRVLINAHTVNSYGEGIESSTAELANSQLLAEHAASIFIIAKEEIFEDGMESEFSRNLSGFIRNYTVNFT